MKKFVTTLLIAVMAFTFMPFIDENDMSAYAGAKYSKPQNLSVSYTPNNYMGVALTFTAPKDIKNLTGRSWASSQIDWRLVGPDVNDDWKYNPAWDQDQRGIDNNYSEYIGQDIEALDANMYILNFEVDSADYEYYFSEYIPKSVFVTGNYKGEKLSKINYNKYAVEVRVRYIVTTFDSDTGYSYEYSDWTPVERYGMIPNTDKPAKPVVAGLAKLTKGLNVKWKKQSDANGFEIKYSLKSSMAGAKTVIVKSATATSKKITNLKAKKKYYVQVRAYKMVDGKKVTSAWSAKKAAKTK